MTSGNAKAERIVKTMEELTGKPANGFVGLVHSDFGNAQRYREKPTTFVKLVQTAIQG